jgi:hypothetical protein
VPRVLGIDVEQQHSPVLQVGKAAPERFKTMVPASSKIESVAYQDSAVFTVEVEGMHGLLVQARLQAQGGRLFATMTEHIIRNVAAIDVYTSVKKW